MRDAAHPQSLLPAEEREAGWSMGASRTWRYCHDGTMTRPTPAPTLWASRSLGFHGLHRPTKASEASGAPQPAGTWLYLWGRHRATHQLRPVLRSAAVTLGASLSWCVPLLGVSPLSSWPCFLSLVHFSFGSPQGMTFCFFGLSLVGLNSHCHGFCASAFSLRTTTTPT